MKLDFNSYPLDIYDNPLAKSMLHEIDKSIPVSKHSRISVSQAILSSFISKAAGAGLLSLIDNASIGINGVRARKCISKLISEQTKLEKYIFSSFLEEAQINLMALSCVTGYLSSLESGSMGNAVRNAGRTILGLLSLRNPLDVIFESTMEISNKYDDICQTYFIAFLLQFYVEEPENEDLVKKLIAESLCNDSEGNSSFSLKKRPILFADVPEKTLEGNLKERVSYLKQETKDIEGMFDPFIKWRIKLNAE